MAWAVVVALPAASNATGPRSKDVKYCGNSSHNSLQNLCGLPMHPYMESCIPMDSDQPNTGSDGFSDWELLFRLEMVARSTRGLFDHRPASLGVDGNKGQSVVVPRSMVGVMDRLLRLARVGDVTRFMFIDAHHALRLALLSSELGRGLLLPPDLQDKPERDLCLALAEVSNSISDAAMADAALKVLVDPGTLRHMAALVERNEMGGASPASTVQVFLQTLVVGQSQEWPSNPSFLARSSIAAMD